MRTSRLRCFAVAATASILFTLVAGVFARPADAATCPMAMSSRKYKVKIDSAPQGATIYLDRKECGAVGVTPWSGTLAAGSYMVIVELEGHEPAQKPIKVARTRSLQETSVPLVKKAEPPRIDLRADADRNVTGATVILDGQSQGTAPLILTTTPGRHLIELKKEGFEPYSTWVEVNVNERITVSPQLREVAKPKFGTIVVEADVPGADVYIDGNKHPDSTPTVITNVIEGLHVIEVRKEPAMPWKQTVQVTAGGQAKVRAELQATIGGAVGSIRVLSNVAGARVFLDGADRGPVDSGVDLKDIKPGEHVIEVRAAGYQNREERVTVNAGSSAVLKLDLTPLVSSEEGTLKVISSVTGAAVVIDGAPVGMAPQEKKIAAGEHFVRVELVGYKPFEEKVRVEAGQTLTVQAVLKAVGTLRVLSNPPGAIVLINGIPAAGVTPLDAEVDAGNTVVRVELNGFDGQERSVSVTGGTNETLSFTMDRSAPTDEQRASEQRGLSSFGARTLPRGRSTVDIAAGFPYFAHLRVGVGAGRIKNFGLDAAVQIRTMLARSELGLGTRLMLVNAEPFSFGAFTDLWYGSKLLDDSKRNGATWDLGVAASLTALTHVTVTGRAWFEAWTDRHCPALDGDGNFDGDAIDSCKSYKDFLAGTAPDFAEDAMRMQELTGLSGEDMFDRDGGARFMTAIAAEISYSQRWNIWFMLEGAPFQKERALFTNLFTGPMFGSDFGTYGKLGATFKF